MPSFLLCDEALPLVLVTSPSWLLASFAHLGPRHPPAPLPDHCQCPLASPGELVKLRWLGSTLRGFSLAGLRQGLRICISRSLGEEGDTGPGTTL